MRQRKFCQNVYLDSHCPHFVSHWSSIAEEHLIVLCPVLFAMCFHFKPWIIVYQHARSSLNSKSGSSLEGLLCFWGTTKSSNSRDILHAGNSGTCSVRRAIIFCLEAIARDLLNVEMWFPGVNCGESRSSWWTQSPLYFGCSSTETVYSDAETHIFHRKYLTRHRKWFRFPEPISTGCKASSSTTPPYVTVLSTRSSRRQS